MSGVLGTASVMLGPGREPPSHLAFRRDQETPEWSTREIGTYRMNLKLIFFILVIATVPVCADAEAQSNATATHARNVLKIISGDKVKTRIYCDMTKVFDQIERAGGEDTQKTDKLYRKMDDLAKKLGPEYAVLVYGLPKVDPNSQDAQEINSTFAALDKLCAK
jgi:hypothetical protein